MIKRNFIYMCYESVLILSKCHVRPYLEYAVLAWSPHLQQDVSAIERVQRRATKLVLKLCNLPYKEKITRLGLMTLEERRVGGDQIGTLKIMSSISAVDPSKFFELNNNNLREKSWKIFKKRSRANMRKSFSQRMCSQSLEHPPGNCSHNK